MVFISHNYPANISKIFKYYSDRFSNIRIIIPFYKDPNDDRVITIYENNWNWQGFLAQAYPKLKDGNFSHYIITADDCLLNNTLDENNILEVLKLDQTSSFITSMHTLASQSLVWDNFSEQKMGFKTPGVEIEKEIPDSTTAVKLIRRHDYFRDIEDQSFISYETLIRPAKFLHQVVEKLGREIFQDKRYKASTRCYPKTTKNLPYPLLVGYSDFLVVNSLDFPYFCHLCGVFASMRMFLEIAIPTALALASSRIVQARDVDYKVKAFWGKGRENELEVLRSECNNSVKNLFLDKRQNYLYFHPIKLSTWIVD